jgi:MoaA/NifB/PqqE/SkfB family radical SAM enzyme
MLQSAVREYQRWANWLKYGDRHFFLDVEIEISAHCNRRCSYCPQSIAPHAKEFMSQETFTATLLRLKEMNWTGPVGYAHYNEPLLDKRLPEFVRQTKAILPKSMPRLFTNGDCLTPALAKELIDAGIVNFCITRHDHGFEKWNAKVLPIAQMFPGYFTLAELHSIPVSNRGGLVVDPALTIQKMDKCEDPEASLHISTKGDCMLCGCDYNHEHTYGNIHQKGILEIWRGKEFKRVRDEVLRGKPRLNICKGCFRDPGFIPKTCGV